MQWQLNAATALIAKLANQELNWFDTVTGFVSTSWIVAGTASIFGLQSLQWLSNVSSETTKTILFSKNAGFFTNYFWRVKVWV
jgi:hypothetical protein